MKFDRLFSRNYSLPVLQVGPSRSDRRRCQKHPCPSRSTRPTASGASELGTENWLVYQEIQMFKFTSSNRLMSSTK